MGKLPSSGSFSSRDGLLSNRLSNSRVFGLLNERKDVKDGCRSKYKRKRESCIDDAVDKRPMDCQVTSDERVESPRFWITDKVYHQREPYQQPDGR